VGYLVINDNPETFWCMLEGIDISHYNDIPNLDDSGLSFCFIKATQGAHATDPSLTSHDNFLKPSHLLVGYYHYFICDIDPVIQAQFFWDTISPLMDDYSLPPVIDLEDLNTAKDPATLHALVQAFLNQIERLCDYKPIVYTGKGFIDSKLAGRGFPTYPLWDAAYKQNPSIPYGGWNDWTFWQYSDKSNNAGVLTDGDLFNGGAHELGGLIKATTFKGGEDSQSWVDKYKIKVV